MITVYNIYITTKKCIKIRLKTHRAHIANNNIAYNNNVREKN